MFEGVTLGERYQVFGRIGGSSLVTRYDGIDTLLVRPVDIVALTPLAASDPDMRDQFQALSRAAATRSHPHIVDVYDLGIHDGQPFVITEHMAGESLRAIIEGEAPFHPDDAVALIQQLAPAADNEVTRSSGGAMVSVDTVLVDASGVAKHTDFLTFGARYTAAAELWSGQPQVSAPPLLAVPAIATIAYALLTAQTPETGMRSAPPSTINAAATPDIDRIVLRALDPRLRDFPSAGAFATALTAAARRARDVREPSPAPTQVLRRPTLPPAPPARLIEEPPAERAHVAQAGSPVPPRLTTPDVDPFDDLETSRDPARRIPWTWLAIAVLAALVIILAVARFREPGPRASNRGAVATNGTAQRLPATIDMGAPTQVAADRVPDVTGLTRDAAAAELARRGMVLAEDQPLFSDTVPAGSVAGQSPKSGASIPSNRTVHVNVSRGPSTIDVASLGLVGKTEAVASRELSAKGLAVQSRQAGSTTVAEGAVISIEPDGLVQPGAAVTLVVSVGDKAQIPREIFSMPFQQAEAELGRAGLEVAGTIKVGPAAIQGRLDTARYQIVSGDVIGIQNQAGDAAFGAWVARGSAVTLVYYDASG